MTLKEIKADRSGKFLKESFVKKTYFNIYEKIMSWSKGQDIFFKDRVFLYFFKIKTPPNCPTCSSQLKLKSFKKGFPKYCSVNCMNNNTERKKKIKEKYLLKYGVESHNQLKKVKEKKKKTTIKNFGVENPMKSTQIKEKQKKSLLNKYGVDNPMKIKSIREKRVGLEQKQVVRMLSRIPSNYELKSYNSSSLTLLHKNCGKKFSITSNFLNGRISNNNELCTNCYPKYSAAFYEICDFLDTYNITYLKNDRTIIKPYELDIYIPKYKIGIEYHGIYWHSNIYKRNDFHLNKYDLSIKKKVKLIQVFETEWKYKKNVVKSIFTKNFNIYKNHYDISNCVVDFISNDISEKFLNENHLYKKTADDINIGLVVNGKLIALMCIKKIDKYSYEITSYTKKLNTVVVNDLKTIFNFFVKNYNPKEIFINIDNRFFTGKSFINLEFKEISRKDPNKWYFELGKLDLVCNDNSYSKYFICDAGYNSLRWIS